MAKIYYTLIAGLLFTGCATTHQPSYIFNEVMVVNNSAETLRNVTVRDAASGRQFDCGDIAPFGICANRFGKRRYAQNPIQIDWAFGSAAARSDEFVIVPPPYHVTGLTMGAVLEISEQGSIEAYFDQDTPI